MSCKIILWRTLKCVLLLIAQLSNYFRAHYSEKWQYWRERENVHSFSPRVAPTDIHKNTNVWSRAWWKLGPIYESVPRLQIDDSKRQAVSSATHPSVFALRPTIFIAKFKNLIQSTKTQTFPGTCSLILYPSPCRPISASHVGSWLWLFPPAHSDGAEEASAAPPCISHSLHFTWH